MRESTVWLVRHAQSLGNVDGVHQGWRTYPLSRLGVAQAEEAAAFWDCIPADLYVSSPLPRALETAQTIFRLSPTVELGLVEPAIPLIEGMTYEEAHLKFPNQVGPNGWALPGAPDHPLLEGAHAVSVRAMRTVRQLARKGEIVAGVTHGAIIAAVLHANGLRNFKIPQNLSAVKLTCRGGSSRVTQVFNFDAESGTYQAQE